MSLTSLSNYAVARKDEQAAILNDTVFYIEGNTVDRQGSAATPWDESRNL